MLRLEVRSSFTFPTGGGKNHGRTLQELGLAQCDLLGMDIKALGQLRLRQNRALPICLINLKKNPAHISPGAS